MTKIELDAFNADLGALCEQYRLKVFYGFYISKPGLREQNGITAAGEKPGPDGFVKMAAVSPRMLDIMGEVEQAF